MSNDEKGKRVFQSFLEERKIFDYQFTLDPFSPVDCYIWIDGEKYAVEIKNRLKKYPSVMLEKVKYYALKEKIEIKDVKNLDILRDSVEIEQLKENLAVKINILVYKIKYEDGYDMYEELVELFNEYQEKGTTIEELRLLYDDVILALS